MPTINCNGIDYYYELNGAKNAPAIVFAHSLFFDHRMFDHQVEAFSRDYRVMTYDQRGHGKTPPPADRDYDMDTLANDMAALIEALDLGPAHIVGNSMGGFLALRLAARRPELVRSAAALGSSAEHEYKADEFRPLVVALKENGGGPVIDTLMYIMFGDAMLADPARAEMCASWRSRMAALPASIGDAADAVVERRAVLPELAGCKRPVLAIAGAEDHAYSEELSRNMADAAPNGRSVVVEGAGHSVALEAPSAVNAHLTRHFQNADAALQPA